ncbi:MAG TPA: transglycosylase domain-containing protein [Mycobacteriales bacterium]
MPGPVIRKAIGVVQLTAAVGVTGVLVAAVALPVTGGIGLAARNSVRAFDEQPCDVEAGVPEQASTMYAADGTTIATFYSQNRTVVPTKKIPKVMRQAIVAIEDRRFYEHHGVDPEALVRAVVKNQQAGDTVQGGSTLTMQYIKNVRLYQAKTLEEQRAAVDKSNGRKLIEARCALELENKQSKDQILTNYLNITYFGAGAYGVEKASQTYFGKPALKLTVPEAAMLAGLVQSPLRYDPYKSKKDAKARRDVVIGDMQSLGYITAKQAAAAKASAIKVKPKAKSSNKDCANTNPKIVNAGFFCDYAKIALKAAGFPQERLETGGLRIYTTLKPSIQNSVQGAMPFDLWRGRKSIAVTDIIEPKTGNVLAFGVARKYGVNPKDKNVTSNPLNTALTAGSGSTYKVFTLVSALQNKVPLEAFQISVGNSYTATVCKNGNDPYTVVNAGKYKEGPYNLDVATYESVNTFFVALLDQRFNCDLTGPVKAAQAMGLVNTLNAKSIYPKLTEGQAYIQNKSASFTLGPNGTSPLELSSAYATLANDGKYCPPTPLRKVVGPDGKAIGLPERSCTQAISPGIAHTVNKVLEKDTTVAGGTAVSAMQGLASAARPIGGKTGTASGRRAGDSERASGNSAAWFVGYTPDYAGATAVFDPKNTSIALTDVPGKEGGNVFGAYSAAIWRNAMEPFLREKTWSFPPADQEVVNGDSVPVQSVVGMDPASATGVLQAGGFQVRIAPEQKDSTVPAGFVAAQSPSGRASRGMTITLYLSNGKGAPGAGTPGLPLPPGQTLPPRPPGRGGGGGGGPGGGGGGGG